MAVNKNFVVKNGLEVNNQLLFADATNNKVGIASTQPNVELDVRGGIAATNTTVSGGISTFSNQIDADASIELAGGLSVTGLSTFSSNVDINADVDVNRSISISGGATVTGLSTFSSNVDINADVDVNRSISISGGLQATGIGTIGRVKIFNDGTGGIVTATTGIVTYYGDGQYLTNIQSGVGIATTNPSTGYSEIVGLGATIITFAGPGVSTNATHAGGTGVTINPSSGIATVYLSGGGGGGGGFETTIVRDSTTVSGTQSVFTSSSPYTSGYIDIFVNGIKQNAGDFTETNSALGTVTLSTAAVDGDIVELVNYEVVAITGEVETLITKEEFTVTTATQTVFDLASTYTTGYIDVYLNGVRLTGSDYTETDSDTITLTTAATFGDIVEFVSFEKRSISELAPVWRNDSVGSGSGGIYTFTSVGVGTSEQTAFFEVYGPAKFRTGIVSFTNSADTDIVRITDGGFNVISGITTLGGNVNSSGNFDINGTDHDFNGTIALDNVQVSAGATIEGNLTLTGAGSTSSIAGALQLTNVNVSGISTSDFAVITNDLTVNGNLNVYGTTTTLDTIVQEVDLLNIQANSATPGLGVTQSGAGAIIAAYDGTSEVFRVDDGGSIGIGTDNPGVKLQITAADPYIRLQDTSALDGYSQIMGTHEGVLVMSADTSNSVASSHLRFDVDGSEKLRITSGGNVNIGGNYTQSTYTSQVTGTLNVTGNITQNGAKLTTTGKAIAMSMIFG
jgi:hypothetical protein